MPLTMLLCDDHALFREGLCALLARRPDWRVVAQAADGDQAVRLAGQHHPDLVLLDVAMPRVDGVGAAAGIRKVSPESRIIAVSMYADAFYRRRMFDAGASAYVLKNGASTELLEAVATVLRGGTYISPTLQGSDAPAQGKRGTLPPLERLTERERQVFRMLAVGLRAREIAEQLDISVKTVETHRARLMLKLDVDNLADLVRTAIRTGVVGVD